MQEPRNMKGKQIVTQLLQCYLLLLGEGEGRGGRWQEQEHPGQ